VVMGVGGGNGRALAQPWSSPLGVRRIGEKRTITPILNDGGKEKNETKEKISQ